MLLCERCLRSLQFLIKYENSGLSALKSSPFLFCFLFLPRTPPLSYLNCFCSCIYNRMGFTSSADPHSVPLTTQSAVSVGHNVPLTSQSAVSVGHSVPLTSQSAVSVGHRVTLFSQSAVSVGYSVTQTSQSVVSFGQDFAQHRLPSNSTGKKPLDDVLSK